MNVKYCDFFCEFARFPDSNALDGACRREVSLFCTKYNRLVVKNSVCLDLRDKKNKIVF